MQNHILMITRIIPKRNKVISLLSAAIQFTFPSECGQEEKIVDDLLTIS